MLEGQFKSITFVSECPYFIRESSPTQASFLEDGKLSKRHAYYFQVQTQPFVYEAEYADFVIATFHNESPNLSYECILLNE